MKNPQTKKAGFITRISTNGSATFEDLAERAALNTTMHKGEVQLASQLFLDAVSLALKNGQIVDLGPVGKLYPSCTSKWTEKEEDQSLQDVKPAIYYRPSQEISAAVASARITWGKGTEEDEDTPTPTPDTQTPTTTPTTDPGEDDGPVEA